MLDKFPFDGHAVSFRNTARGKIVFSYYRADLFCAQRFKSKFFARLRRLGGIAAVPEFPSEKIAYFKRLSLIGVLYRKSALSDELSRFPESDRP